MVRIHSLGGLHAIHADWDALYDASKESNVFLTWEWIANWAEHLAQGFVVLAHRHGSQLDALAAFSTEDPAHWSWIDEHSYRPGVLARPGVRLPLRRIFTHVLVRERAVRSLRLNRSLQTPAFAAEVHRSLGPLALLSVESSSDVARIVATDTTSEQYLASRPTKVRHELKRKVSKLENSAEGILFLELENDPDGVRALEIVEAVERNSWKVASNTAIVSSERERRFYKGVFAMKTARTRGRLFYLAKPADGARAGDPKGYEPIGFVLGVQHDDAYYALKTSFREDFAPLSPGQVLFQKLIEHLCDREAGVGRLELLGKDSRWKRELATETRAECCYEILRPDVRGIVRAVAKKHVLPALRQAAAEEGNLLGRAWTKIERLRGQPESKPTGGGREQFAASDDAPVANKGAPARPQPAAPSK